MVPLQVSMMLNTDFEVFYELDLDGDSQAQCNVQSDALTCQKSETYDIAAQYAEVRQHCQPEQNQNLKIIVGR